MSASRTKQSGDRREGAVHQARCLERSNSSNSIHSNQLGNLGQESGGSRKVQSRLDVAATLSHLWQSLDEKAVQVSLHKGLEEWSGEERVDRDVNQH